MLLRNVWYVAAWSTELQRGLPPLGRRLVGDPVVMFRTSSGRIGALEDRCSHRGMAISQGGECDGEIVRCPYHGLEFDATGTCRRIPGQDVVPSAAHIRSYPTVERDGLIWIWMGDAALAASNPVPEHPFHSDPKWVWASMQLHVRANWELFNDNLLDLSHLGFVHKDTIGGDSGDVHASAALETIREGNSVTVRRQMANIVPAPYFLLARKFAGRVDRVQEIHFVPGVLRLDTCVTDAGGGALEGRYEGGVRVPMLHAITPESESTTHYFATTARDFRLDDVELTAKLRGLSMAAFIQDKDVLEMQQQRLDEQPERGFMNLRSDGGTVHARRIVQELYEKEQRIHEHREAVAT